jgi:hypothetical protein
LNNIWKKSKFFEGKTKTKRKGKYEYMVRITGKEKASLEYAFRTCPKGTWIN